MKLIPFYRVSYRGDFHEAGSAFAIDPADREEMDRHGNIVDEPEAHAELAETPVTQAQAEAKPKRGRPRRAEDG